MVRFKIKNIKARIGKNPFPNLPTTNIKKTPKIGM
jgi:hypothetical protein